MADNDDVEVRDLPQATTAVTALTRRQADAIQSYGGSASFPLADLSDAEFATLTNRMRTHISRLKQIQRDLMIPGVHYGVPGERDPEKIKKAADQGKVGIYKAGAEFLAKLHNHVGRVEYAIDYGDPKNEATPAITVRSTCHVHLGDTAGPLVGIGVGAATSWEIKYRYRNAQRVCPACNQPALMMSKYEAKGGPFKGQKPWWCNSKAGGCGVEFAPDDKRITEQEVGKTTNPDAYDLLNTLVKMSAKRARVDGEITASAASDLFTQDVEDLPPHEAERMRREVDEGAKATTDEMYGTGDPDAWRSGVEGGGAGAASEPAASSSGAARPGTPAAPAPATPPASGPALITDKQMSLIRTLLNSKFGVRGAEAQDAKCSELLKDSVALPTLTRGVASGLIEHLNKLPDHQGAPAAPAPTRGESLTQSGGALPDSMANRDRIALRVRELAAAVEKATPGRKVLDVIEGIVHVVGGNEMVVLKLSKPTPLEYLDVQQLTQIGHYLKDETTRLGVMA